MNFKFLVKFTLFLTILFITKSEIKYDHRYIVTSEEYFNNEYLEMVKKILEVSKQEQFFLFEVKEIHKENIETNKWWEIIPN